MHITLTDDCNDVIAVCVRVCLSVFFNKSINMRMRMYVCVCVCVCVYAFSALCFSMNNIK